MGHLRSKGDQTTLFLMLQLSKNDGCNEFMTRFKKAFKALEQKWPEQLGLPRLSDATQTSKSSLCSRMFPRKAVLMQITMKYSIESCFLPRKHGLY